MTGSAPAGRWLDTDSGRRASVAALALVSAVLAVVASRLLFPHLSINNDEPIYRLQARALADGHLFPATGGVPDAFTPWLAAVRDGHYVLKYPPFFPGLVAVSYLLSGGSSLFFAVLAAAVVVVTYGLASEVLGSKRQAFAAAVLLALSPLAVVLDSLVLPYMTALLLLEAGAWGIVRGARAREGGGGRGPLVVAGLAVGAAFAMRPYDTVLFAGPLVLYLASRSGPVRSRARALAELALPASLGLVAFLAANAVMTGNPLKPPFALLEGRDALGFGTRRLYPTDVDHEFGPVEAVRGVLAHGLLLNRWVAGGTLLLVVAGVALARSRRGDSLRWLAAAGAAVPAGYLFFWGPWNASVLWGGTRWVGPFYFLPVLVPLALLGARGLAELHRWRPPAARLLAGAMAAFTVVAFAPVVGGNLEFNRQSRSLAGLLDASYDGRDKLVLVAPVDPYLMHPSAVVANRWDLSGPRLHTLARGDADVALVEGHPERTPYFLDLLAGSVKPDDPFRARLAELRVVRGPQVSVEVVVRTRSQPGRREVLRIHRGSTTMDYALPGGPTEQSLRLELSASGGITLQGWVPDREYRQDRPGKAGLGVELVSTPAAGAGTGPGETVVAAQELPSRAGTDGTALEVLVPTGRTWTVGDPLPAPPPLEVSVAA